MIEIAKSMYTIISVIAAAVAVYFVQKYTKWNALNTFVVLIIMSYSLQCAQHIFVNYEHYFGNYRK